MTYGERLVFVDTDTFKKIVKGTTAMFKLYYFSYINSYIKYIGDALGGKELEIAKELAFTEDNFTNFFLEEGIQTYDQLYHTFELVSDAVKLINKVIGISIDKFMPTIDEADAICFFYIDGLLDALREAYGLFNYNIKQYTC